MDILRSYIEEVFFWYDSSFTFFVSTSFNKKFKGNQMASFLKVMLSKGGSSHKGHEARKDRVKQVLFK